MAEREIRKYKKMMRLKRERMHKCFVTVSAAAVAACMVMLCASAYGSIRSQASGGFKYYTSVTVNGGETLWSLADQYADYDFYEDRDAYIAELKNINHLEDDGFILAGQTIIVPYYSSEYIY